MKKSRIQFQGIEINLIKLHTLVVGSGAAGLNAAIQLYESGVEDIAILTEKWGGGTSNNAGSDKQTYYRLAPDSPEGDSINLMANDLFSGGCMHGDIALIESAYSLQAFYHLVSTGVPFPHDEYGRYPGFQTDHDSKGRGTSAGPLTSKMMFQNLARKIVDYNIPIFDNSQLIRLLLCKEGSNKPSVCGALVLNHDDAIRDSSGFTVFQNNAIVLATGGPGEIYNSTVYPKGQYGATGIALEAGAYAQNLMEFQFGIASTRFRWNLSGSYQQVIPRYYSEDSSGVQYDFLNEYYPNVEDLSKAIFLKGYQWPFDTRKLSDGGSSMIDLLIYQEIHFKGRKVYMDYTRNPILESGKEMMLSQIANLAYQYLNNSEALAETPIERLLLINKPAYDLYRKNGIRLDKEAIEIDICAQHCNGGLSASIWWESNISKLFPVGEANGTHGVYRPGGSALNSGQVGGIRAAKLISQLNLKSKIKQEAFLELVYRQVGDLFDKISNTDQNDININWEQESIEIKVRMSKYGGIIRSKRGCEQGLAEAKQQFERLSNITSLTAIDCSTLTRLLEQLRTQMLIFKNIIEYIAKGGASRGSYLIATEEELNSIPFGKASVNADPQKSFTSDNILQLQWTETDIITQWVAVRPVPEDYKWFETTWKAYRNKKIIRRD